MSAIESELITAGDDFQSAAKPCSKRSMSFALPRSRLQQPSEPRRISSLRGKLLPRERIDRLLTPARLFELMSLAGRNAR